MLLCKLCNTLKTPEEFQSSKQHVTGRDTRCRICRAKTRKNDKTRRKFAENNGLLENINKCPICENTMTLNQKESAARFAVVDHNHANGAIRGILCSSCNGALGKLGDSLECIERAWNYMQNSILMQEKYTYRDS